MIEKNRYLSFFNHVCVAVPRNPGQNQVWEFDIELGNTADEAKDDPGEMIFFSL